MDMMKYVVEHIQVNDKILDEDTYLYIFSVEEVNKKVKDGIPFRDAYREVASDIDKGRYRPGRDFNYTHLGSIGNPGLKEIESKLDKVLGQFPFVDMEKVVDALSTYYENT